MPSTGGELSLSCLVVPLTLPVTLHNMTPHLPLPLNTAAILPRRISGQLHRLDQPPCPDQLSTLVACLGVATSRSPQQSTLDRGLLF